MTNKTPEKEILKDGKNNPFDSSKFDFLLKRKPNQSDALMQNESQTLEFKKAFHVLDLHKYSKTLVGMANNNGGYILFGVQDNDRRILGLANKHFEDFDSKKLTEIINSYFSGGLDWQRTTVEIEGKVLGILFVSEAIKKPIICQKNKDSILKEGDIYFRYSGVTTKILFKELQDIIMDREARIDEKWRKTLENIASSKPENVLVLDNKKGVLEGVGVSLVVDENLLSKMNIIQEGRLETKEGSPAYKIIGEIKSTKNGTEVALAKQSLTAFDIIEDFIKQKKVPNPEAYIKFLCTSNSRWLPVYYFSMIANLDREQLIKVIKNNKHSRKPCVDWQIKRITGPRIPKSLISPLKYLKDKEKLISEKNWDFSIDSEIKGFLNSIRFLKKEEVDQNYIFSVFGGLLESYDDLTDSNKTTLRYAVSYLDGLLFGFD